jgi:hypothetical protein
VEASGPFWLGWAVGAAAALTLVLGAFAHRAHPRSPRAAIVSGRASPRLSASGREERWEKRKVSVTLDPTLAALGPDAHGAVERAFGAWFDSGASLPDLVFDVATSRASPDPHADGVNSVIYAPITLPGHTDDLAITIAYSDDATGELVEADIVVNSRKPFGLLDDAHTDATPSCTDERHGHCGEEFDLQSIVTHEVGHFFGLGEDRTDRLATMFECSSPCETHKRDLDSEDDRAIESLYSGVEPVSAQASAGCSVARNVSPEPALGVALLVLLASSARRSRRSSR